MANLKYIIRTHKNHLNKQGQSIIFLRYTHRGRVMYISTGRTISPEWWNTKNQQVKQGYQGFSLFNQYLAKLRGKIENYVHQALSEEKDPSIEYVKEKLKIKKDEKSKQVSYLDFFSFFKQFIQLSKTTKAKGTVAGYENSLRVFEAFEKYSGQALTFDSFDMSFYDSFRYYLIQNRGFCNNSFGKQIKTLKTVLNNAVERGYVINQGYKSKKFQVISEDVDNIYLNEDEIDSLINLDLSDQERLAKIRDLFIVGCLTGLKFSDFSEIQPENIKENFIKIRTVKTNQNVVIPFHPRVKEILAKYKGVYPNCLPPSISNQKMNDNLKIIGKKAGICEDIVVVKQKGNNRLETVCKKYDLITTHCARRSFATNLFKQGFPAINIMKITGHTSEKSFMKYIKVNQEEAAGMLQRHWDNYYRIPVEPILKIA